MNQDTSIKPMPLWQTALVFGLPILWGITGMYGLLSYLDKSGVPMIWNYMLSMFSMFPLLLILSLIALKIESGSISWPSLKDRFRIHSLSRKDWVWTLFLIVIYVGGQLLLMPTAGWLVNKLPLPIPDSLPPAIDPRMVKSTIPTHLWGIPLSGNWQLAGLYLIILIMNIVSEEFWWRGYVLPRQELQHGRYAWVLHGILWTLFHVPFWWNLLALLPSTLSLSYVVSKLKNTTPGIITHSVMNGLGFIVILMGVMGVSI